MALNWPLQAARPSCARLGVSGQSFGEPCTEKRRERRKTGLGQAVKDEGRGVPRGAALCDERRLPWGVPGPRPAGTADLRVTVWAPGAEPRRLAPGDVTCRGGAAGGSPGRRPGAAWRLRCFQSARSGWGGRAGGGAGNWWREGGGPGTRPRSRPMAARVVGTRGGASGRPGPAPGPAPALRAPTFPGAGWELSPALLARGCKCFALNVLGFLLLAHLVSSQTFSEAAWGPPTLSSAGTNLKI